MIYELWDFDSGNAQGVYPSLEGALDVLRRALERDGQRTLDALALLEVGPDGERRLVAEERELLSLIQAAAVADHPTT